MIDKKMELEITAIIAETLKQHSEVQIKGLGVFSVHHQKQDHRQEKDGRVLLAPPSDIITFVPEK
jgi:nucleoid DNA-binding protein